MPSGQGLKQGIEFRFTLSSGDTIDMPWHIYKAQHIILIAEAQNVEMVSEFLKDLGMYPLLTSGGKPIAIVGIVEYVDSAAGSYNEMYVSFVASYSPPLG